MTTARFERPALLAECWYSNPAVFGVDGALVSRYWLSVLLITAAESDERMALAGRRDLAAAYATRA